MRHTIYLTQDLSDELAQRPDINISWVCQMALRIALHSTTSDGRLKGGRKQT